MEWEGRKRSEQLPENFPHFFDGVETVADLIFFLGGHLAEGLAAFVEEQGIVAEAALALKGGEQ